MNSGILQQKMLSWAAMNDGALKIVAGFAFAEYGSPDGPVALALHGSPGCHLTFRSYASIAEKTGLRLIALDRLGYGSTRLRPTTDLEYWSGLIARLLDELEISTFSILGTSGGAPYALGLAATLGRRVRETAIVAGVGAFDQEYLNSGMLGINRLMNSAAKGGYLSATVVGTIVMGLSRLAPDIFLKTGIKLLPQPDQEEMARSDVHDNYVEISKTLGLRSGEAFGVDFSLFRSEWVNVLGDIKCPVKWWHGRLDKNVPLGHAINIVSRLDRGEIVVIEDGGHLLLRRTCGDVVRYLLSSD